MKLSMLDINTIFSSLYLCLQYFQGEGHRLDGKQKKNLDAKPVPTSTDLPKR